MSVAAILGGGIAGLSTAYYLTRTAQQAFKRIILIEGSNHLGGWIKSVRQDNGAVFEHGPRSLRGSGQAGINALELAEDLGLESKIIAVPRSRPAAQNRFIYVNNKIHILPNSFKSLVRKTEPFDKAFIRYLINDLITKGKRNGEDETIYDFVARRLGSDMANYAIDPLCRGVYAGDAKQLSIKSTFHDLWKFEQENGGIIKGALIGEKQKVQSISPLVERSKKERWAIWSLDNGIQGIPDRMVDVLNAEPNVEIMTETKCTDLDLSGPRVKVTCDNSEILEVDHVFSTLPAMNLSPAVSTNHQLLSSELSKIPYVDVAVVNVELKGQVMPFLGFGHLIPSTENSKVLGIVYDSCNFPEHDRKDQPSTRLTCMMGGAWFRQLFGDPETANLDTFTDLALEAVREQMGITADPSEVCTTLQRNCIPQYVIGHSQVMDNINGYLESHKLPLSLLGASYKGVSVNDCIYHAKLEVERVTGETLP
ncbi:unnamed protein product [Owenia fusiformis]|uniref:Protoporphyrinogen oxidase n=1 Tax=Owenia fusiformis TaxID=6347 RepID=A0A8J1V150_OWEFU|nr:unnamed protein product [Owenia fusiformis]